MAVLQQQCNNVANYFIEGSTLPYTFTLDTTNSVLDPPVGQNQKFVYIVASHGTDTSDFLDLSHFVLGICGDITEADLLNVTTTTTQNGEPLTIVGDISVETDPTTGCSGLKVEFLDNGDTVSLPKTEGTVFTLTFELETPYPIGPISVCVKGGNDVLNNLTICGPICDASICDSTVYRQVKVCAPVDITPSVSSGTPIINCCGEPTVSNNPCSSTSRSCRFSISQCLCVAIPVSFSATAVVDTENVVCEEPTGCTCEDCPPAIEPTTP